MSPPKLLSEPAFWLRFVLVFPVVMIQGLWLRRTAKRMPVMLSNGERGTTGVQNDDQTTALDVMIVGESTAVGVGCHHANETLAHQLAGNLAERYGCAVHWQVIGGNGMTVAQIVDLLGTQVPVSPQPQKIAVVFLGVNDVVAMTSRRQWQERLLKLRQRLRERGVSRVFLTPVPPMWGFTLLPNPLRWLLGLRARMLDATQALLVEGYEDTVALVTDFPDDPSMLAEDGYHPGPRACEFWAKKLAKQIAENAR
ncbi:MAG: SGNH/GDSL hydrolase family protein [Woeseiaceae bacterium]